MPPRDGRHRRCHERAERRRHAISRISRLRRRLETEQSREHELHLLLGGVPTANDRLLDGGGRHLFDPDAVLLGGEHDHAARVSEHDCRPHILGVEHVLDREHVRPMALDDFDDPVVDLTKARAKRGTRMGSNDSAFDQRMRGTVALHHAVAGDGGAGVDSQYNHDFLNEPAPRSEATRGSYRPWTRPESLVAFAPRDRLCEGPGCHSVAIAATSMSKFAQTFCTSSSSSSSSSSLSSAAASLPSTLTVRSEERRVGKE